MHHDDGTPVHSNLMHQFGACAQRPAVSGGSGDCTYITITFQSHERLGMSHASRSQDAAGCERHAPVTLQGFCLFKGFAAPHPGNTTERDAQTPSTAFRVRTPPQPRGRRAGCSSGRRCSSARTTCRMGRRSRHFYVIHGDASGCLKMDGQGAAAWRWLADLCRPCCGVRNSSLPAGPSLRLEGMVLHLVSGAPPLLSD